MADPLPNALSSSGPLDARLRSMLRELPREHAGLLEALLQERDLLVAVAERRAERVQRLHEASAAMLRTLERDELELEAARQLLRLVQCEGVVVARAGSGGDTPTVVVHVTAEGPADLAETGVVLPGFDEVIRTGRPARLGLGGDAQGAVMAVPLMHGFRLMGIIAAYSNYSASFSEEDLEATQALGTHAATALVNSALYAQSERERRQSDALASLARALGSATRPHEVLRLALRHAMALFGCDGADIALKRDEFLQVVAAEGGARTLQGMFIPLHGSVSGKAVREGRAFIVNDADTDPDAYATTRRLANVRNTLVAPLLSATGAVGIIGLVNRERPFDAEDARMLQQFATQVAVAIASARLYEEAAEAQKEMSAAFEAVGDGIVVLDADARVVRSNARFLAMTGLPDDDSTRGRDFYDVILHEPRELTEDCVIGQAILMGKVSRAQMRSAWNGRVLEMVAAPHPAGGAVVTVDDVSDYHTLAERHRLVVENTTDAILITTAEGELEFANPAAIRLFGHAAPLAGMRLGSLLPASEATVWAEAIARARRGEAARLDGVVNRGDERRQVSVSVAPLLDESSVSHLVISLRDVTSEALARDESAAANARYRDLVEAAADAIVTLDTRGVFTSINPAMETLTGHGRDVILGRSYAPFLEPVESAQVKRQFEAAVAGELRRLELHLVRADGDRRLISVALTPMRRAGVVVGVLAMARDVTEERGQAAALVTAEARYTRLVDAAEDAIACVDEEGNFTAVNRALEHVLKTPRADLLGRHFMDVVLEDERPAMWQAFVQSLSGERLRRTIRFVRADGVVGYTSMVTAPIIENGHVTGVLGIARDVTEERLLLEQAIRQDKMAAMGELVGGVAHEVNSPLTSILAYAQVLERGVLEGEERQRAIETIGKEARRAARIVGKLLSFARQGGPERMPSDLNQVVRDTIDLRRYALKMQEVKLSVSLAPDLPMVEADPFQLQQVFINLLSNAEQAVGDMPGERRISVTTGVRGDHLVATISDNGPGIAPETLPHIFNPFFTTKPRGSGTGLGLSISDGIIHEHHGTLRVRSEPGAGATFEIELPLQPAST
ncbi:MAG: PAS domain S-box protein [Gemmatimonadaceae bacterium]